jgi:acyl-coenzyme A thioesterase PaaI-like protein
MAATSEPSAQQSGIDHVPGVQKRCVVLGGSVVANRHAEHWAVTTEISVDFCSPIRADASTLTAQGRAVHLDANGGPA